MINVKCHAGLAAPVGGGRKGKKLSKRGEFASVDQGVLQGDNARRMGQLGKGRD